MAHLILPKANLKALIRRRRKLGQDRYDEVWNGVYVMSPLANNEHQRVALRLAAAILDALAFDPDVKASAGANVSDREDDWTRNYRVPDVVVYLPGNPAEDRDSHWLGGPDFAVEVISKGDRSRRKLDFYAKVGVRELLLIDRSPWRLELYRNADGILTPAGAVGTGDAGTIESAVLPIALRLIATDTGPKIEVTHTADGRVWLA